MEVVGALASSLQIVSQCGQVTLTIVKWVESVRTVDERIDAFIHEVSTLRMTYESLSRSLKDPSMLESARITNRDVGGHLWTQMSRTLRDCEATMNSIAIILAKIQTSSNILRPVVKQLKESLHSGELVRLREQVVMFNSSLQLPMQMITLTMQLRQQEMTTAHQLHLNEQLALLRRGIERIERLSKDLSKPVRTISMSGTTVLNDASDKAWIENMEDYVGTAKKFLNSASVAASTLSAPSTGHHDDDSPIANDVRRGSSFTPLTHQKLKSITMYVDDLVDSGAGSRTPLPSDDHSGTEANLDAIEESDNDSDDDDVDLQLLKALLQNGNSELVRLDHAAAEDNFREALLVSQSNNFGSQIACSTADIALMLGECLAKQDKLDEAIDLLQPLASESRSYNEKLQSSALSTFSSSQVETDKGQMLAANHLLGKVYLNKADYINAEKCSVQAFKGRKKLFGESHAKTIESVHLVIEMYKAKGQNARAEAHRIFLKPVESSQPVPVGLGRLSPSPPPTTEPIAIPQSTSPNRTRRPTFNFSSAFKRSEKIEVASTSLPAARIAAAGQPFLIADEFNHLSVSPNDTSSLHMGSDIRPFIQQNRKESSNSNGSFAHVQRWDTTSDVVGGVSTHQRTQSSLSKTPTLYADMSQTEMEQKFLEVSKLCDNGKTSKGVERGLRILQQYDPDSAILVHRTAELKDTIKRSKSKGLAGSGYGFAPLHFFCSLKYEPLMEIDILLRLNADPNAVGYKAGYGKADPFVPLTLAVERGHENIVRMLLERGAVWQSEVMRSGYRFNADRDRIHPLLQACQKGNTRIVETLLQFNIDLTEELFPRLSWHGNSLLHEASFRCDLELVELLMGLTQHKGTQDGTGYSFIGTPSQQDEFGLTPIMHAVDMRECNEKLRAHKVHHRIRCLRLLLSLDNAVTVRESEGGEIMVEHLPQSRTGAIATTLHLEDKKGNTVYWYADESRGGDSQLTAFLDEQSRKSQLIEL